jgi:hypothetical protein
MYYTTLVNGGIISPNEAREGLRLSRSTDPEMDKIRVPQNIVGSATDPSQGGRPVEEDRTEPTTVTPLEDTNTQGSTNG